MTDIDTTIKKMLQLEQAPCPVIHRFSPGLYIRELRMCAGMLAIGHYQRFEHLNLFLQGRIIMIREDGTKSELTAPMIFTAPPGRKQGYVIEDVVWLNIYPTTETDIKTLEATYLDIPQYFKDYEKKVRIGDRSADVIDYKKLLGEFGVTEEQVRAETEIKSNQIGMPTGDYKFLISDSNIEGQGVFASANIEAGETIGPARIDDKRTFLGRYVNHSAQGNAKMINVNGDIYLVSTQIIEGCRGGLPGEEITTDYRKNLKLIGATPCQQQ